MGVSKKEWYPQIMNVNGVFHYKPSILGYPYFWKQLHAVNPFLKQNHGEKSTQKETNIAGWKMGAPDWFADVFPYLKLRYPSQLC